MNNPYRNMMEQQHLSEQAKQAFYYNLQHSEHKEKHSFILKMAAVAVCILLLIPITVYAVEHIFGVSVVAMITGIVIGTVGIALVCGAYPVYKKVTRKERERIAPEIIRLTDELMKF